MEEIRSSAIVYYEKLSKVEKQSAENLFQNLDVNGDGKIGFQVYKAKLKEEEKHMKQLTDPRFFKNLDRNKDGFLDKQDTITLFYLVKSGRLRFCDSCGEFLIGRYFPCSQCFDSSTDGSFYKLCGSCYGSGTFSHHHDHAKFVANDLLQRRKESESGNSVQPNKSNRVDRKQTLVYDLMIATAGNFIARELVVGTEAVYNQFKEAAGSDAATSHVPDPTAGANSSLFGSSPAVPDPSAGAASSLFGSSTTNPVPDPSAGAASSLFGVPDPSAGAAGAASSLFGSSTTNPVPDPSAGAASSLFGSPVPDPSAGAASSLFGSPVPDPSAASNLVGGAATYSVPDPSGGFDFSSVFDFLGALLTS